MANLHNSTFINGQMSLETLWRLLEQQRRHNASMANVIGLNEDKILLEGSKNVRHGMTTLELVIVQGVLLAVLIILSVVWACCCKKRCIGDQSNLSEFSRALARKLSTSSNRTLPPSYSKVDLTSVGLTLNDHLNPPPSYDRLIAMLESGEITSVPIHLHPEVERRISMSSAYTANNRSRRESVSSSRKSSKHSVGSLSADESRKSSRVTFAPNLIQSGSKDARKESSQSLPSKSVLIHLSSTKRKASSKSEGSAANMDSRKVSFIDEFMKENGSKGPNGSNRSNGANGSNGSTFDEELKTRLDFVKEGQSEARNNNRIIIEERAEDSK